MSLTGISKGISYYLEGKRAIIGRSEKADISILDPQASREHAEIVRFKDSFIVTDLKSQNGVMVNDLKVVQHTLVPGDKVIIGSTVFKYDLIEVEKNALDIAFDSPDLKYKRCKKLNLKLKKRMTLERRKS